MRLLLLSNSTNPGEPYLAHAREAIRDFLGPARRVVFVPFAAVRFDHGSYLARVREGLSGLSLSIDSVPEANPVPALADAEAIMVGGGNTFALLARLHQAGLLGPIRERVSAGTPYIGWSAGSNLACPTIRTTNDMPIVEPPSLEGLGLVPFQINPHYTEQRIPGHGGESRDERLAEFLELNRGLRVVGLREGSSLRVEGSTARLLGPHPLRLFEPEREPRELDPGDDLDFLMLSAAW